MNNTICLTSIYEPFWGTEEFLKSTTRLNIPVHNVWKGKGFTGHNVTFRSIYDALLELKNDYKFAIYADAADSIFLKTFTPPPHTIVYSTEKMIWPPLPLLKQRWKDYNDDIPGLRPPWKYLNGGGWCGPVELLIEFFDRFGLNKHTSNINGQNEHSMAFLDAKEQGFPITLDYQCRYFQTTGFEEPGDFYADETIFKNLITGTEPFILHGNGRTPMAHLYKLYN